MEIEDEASVTKIARDTTGIIRYGPVLVSACLTAIIGYLIYRQVPDWRQSFRVMVQGSITWLLAGLGFATLHMLLRAKRWGVLLKGSKEGISFRNLFSLTLVKYVVNIIPPRTGEVAASFILAKKENISASTVIAASVFERILDMVTVVVIMILYLMFFGRRYAPDSEGGRQIMVAIQSYSIKLLIGLTVAMVVVVLLLRRRGWAQRLPLKMQKTAAHFVDGFHSLQSGGATVQAVVLSAAIWLTITVQIWCVVKAYLNPFPLAGAILLVGLTVVGVAIPTPAGAGGFQYFMSLGLINFFGHYLSAIDPMSQAAGICNGCYIAVTVPVLIAGMAFLNAEGASLGGAVRIGRQVQAAGKYGAPEMDT